VEADARAARAARTNITALGAGTTVTLTTAKVERVLDDPPDAPYDIVFADPPYAMDDDEVASVLARLLDGGWLAPDALVVVERATRSPEPRWPSGLTMIRGRRYGETTLWYGRGS
jgi:16S rRNA G966 N2-methylase RsmD